MKIGTDAWRIDARPESILVSPHERSQNGTAVFRRPTTTSGRQCARRSAPTARPPTSAATTTASVSAASQSRPRISVDGATSRSATLMNMNELPQIKASAPRSTIGRLRVISVF